MPTPAAAIVASENNTITIADVPPLGVEVQRGHTLDGLGKYYRLTIEEAPGEGVDVVQALKDNEVDVLVSYLPVGSEEADKFYAQAAIDAGVAFVNALPVFIASDPEWAQKFEDAGVPIIGDDIKSQVGATITHRVMAKLFEQRGVEYTTWEGWLQLDQHEVGLGEHRRTQIPGLEPRCVVTVLDQDGGGVRMDGLPVERSDTGARRRHGDTRPAGEAGQHAFADR